MGGKHFKKGKHSGEQQNKKSKNRKIRFFSFVLIILFIIFGINFMQGTDFIEEITKEKNPPTTVDISNIPDKMGKYKVLRSNYNRQNWVRKKYYRNST